MSPLTIHHWVSKSSCALCSHSWSCVPFWNLQAATYELGAKVVAEQTLHLTSQSQSYGVWLVLHVPEGNLPLGTAIKVQVSLTGQFKILAGSQLVSAVYWLYLHLRPYRFCSLLAIHCYFPPHPLFPAYSTWSASICWRVLEPYGSTSLPSFSCVATKI